MEFNYLKNLLKSLVTLFFLTIQFNEFFNMT